MAGARRSHGRWSLLVACVLLVAGSVPAAAAAPAAPEPSPGSDVQAYVVQAAPSARDGSGVRDALRRLGADPERELALDVPAFTVELTPEQAELLSSSPAVGSVEEDVDLVLHDVQHDAPWGLDRLDQAALPRDGTFTYPSSAGAGVRVYVVDTGVWGDHPQLRGRVAPGWAADGASEQEDCDGHGTHVAGVVGAERFGVAKRSSVVPVRVFTCDGEGRVSDLLSGLSWILGTHPEGSPGVVNLSLGVRDRHRGLDEAVERLVDHGLFVVAAAGNSAGDACLHSPAAPRATFTVAASTLADARAPYSNHGRCVDAFAPGDRIPSLHHGDAGLVVTMSGTSMAAPHVAGLAALHLAQSPSAPPAVLARALRAEASRLVTDARGAPPLLVTTASLPVGEAIAPSGRRVVPVAPVRVLDDRFLVAGAPRCVKVAGTRTVPAGVTGVMVNVTAVRPSNVGYAVIYPDSDGTGRTPPPQGSTVAFEPGTDVANSTFVSVPANGRVCYAAHGGQVRLLVDVSAYVLPGSGIVTTTPLRVLDTRARTQTGDVAGPVEPRRTYTVDVARGAGVPTTATAVVLNVTVTGPTAPGHLRVFPADRPPPSSSTVNYVPRRDKANGTVVPLVDGRISFYSDTGAPAAASPVHVVLDVVGWVEPGAALTAVPPVRVLETRPAPYPQVGFAGPVRPGSEHVLGLGGTPAVPRDATAVIMNVTAVQPTSAGHLRVYPDGSGALPGSSAVNYVRGRAIPNLVVAALPPDGHVRFFSDQRSGSVHLLADVVGYLGD